MKLSKILMIGVAAAALAGCGQRVKYNEAAVEVIDVGSHAGVQEQEISTGRYWAPPFSYRYIVKFPTTQQTFTWGNGFEYINADRVSVTQKMAANIRINPPDADNIVRKYRGAITKGGGKDGYVLDEIINGPVTRELQQAFIEQGTKYTSAQLYADGGGALLRDVKAQVAPKFAKDGIIIEDVMISGKPELPENIVQSIQASLLAVENAKRKQAELAAVEAEGKKTVAQERANSEAREIKAASIRANPEVMKLEEIQKWRGVGCPVGAKVCVIGSDAATLLNPDGE